MTLLFRMLAFFVVGCCSLQICAAVKTKVDSNLILESVELDASGYQIEVASDSLVSQPSSKNITLKPLPMPKAGDGTLAAAVTLAAELAAPEDEGPEILSLKRHLRAAGSSRTPAVRRWFPPRLNGVRRQLPAQVPSDIRNRVQAILKPYGGGPYPTTLRLFDFDTTLFPSDDFKRFKDLRLPPTVPKEVMYAECDKMAFSDSGLIFSQPGISVIVTNGDRGWIRSCMSNMPHFEAAEKSGKLAVIATRDFFDHPKWAELNVNKLNVFPFVLGAFAAEGVFFDTLYSYGDGVLDMKAGEYTTNYYDFGHPSGTQKWIGVRFTEEATTAEILMELKILIGSPPMQHIELVPAGGNEAGSLLLGETNAKIEFKVVPRTETVDGNAAGDICHGWREELRFYYEYAGNQRMAEDDYCYREDA